MMQAPRMPSKGPPPNSSYSNRVLSSLRLAAIVPARLGGESGEEPGHLLLERREEELDGPFARLEQDVADEPLADDDAGVPLVDVAPLDVADEPIGQRAALIEGAGGPGQVGPLVVLGADVHQADPGLGDAEDRLGVDGPHDAVLVQVLGLGIHVGADVDDDDRAAVRGEDRGDPRPSDAGQEHLGVEQRRGDHGAGVARRDDRLDVAAGHQAPAPRDRVVPLLAERLDGLLVHADDLAGVDDRQSVAGRLGGLGQLGLDLRLVADEHDDQLRLVADRLDGASDDRAGGVVASHRVQGNPHRRPPGRVRPETEERDAEKRGLRPDFPHPRTFTARHARAGSVSRAGRPPSGVEGRPLPSGSIRRLVTASSHERQAGRGGILEDSHADCQAPRPKPSDGSLHMVDRPPSGGFSLFPPTESGRTVYSWMRLTRSTPAPWASVGSAQPTRSDSPS